MSRGRPILGDKNVDLNKFKQQVKDCLTYNELRKQTGICLLRLKRIINDNNISIKHFTPGKGKSTRGTKSTRFIKRVCPVCDKIFQTTERYPATCCGHACANTHFRKNWNEKSEKAGEGAYNKHRKICFRHHGRKCIICNETVAVDAHHIDGNHKNDDPGNLVPLCANHHRYVHMKRHHHHIDKAIKNFLQPSVAETD